MSISSRPGMATIPVTLVKTVLALGILAAALFLVLAGTGMIGDGMESIAGMKDIVSGVLSGGLLANGDETDTEIGGEVTGDCGGDSHQCIEGDDCGEVMQHSSEYDEQCDEGSICCVSVGMP